MKNAMLQTIAREERSAVETWVQGKARSCYLGDHKALCRVLGHYNLLVPTEDLSLAPHLMLDGYWEMWITQAVARHVKPGMRCIDVGANVGYYTLLLADLVGEQGKVQAWEPQEALVALIETSLALNGLCAETVAAAAGRAVGGAYLKVPGQFMGSAALGTEGTPVIVGRLDKYTKGQVDFVKIDAEGSEHAVWDGMEALLENPSITVLMEFAPVICEEPSLLLEKIKAAGFPLRWLNPDGAVAALSRSEALEGEWKMLWLQRQT